MLKPIDRLSWLIPALGLAVLAGCQTLPQQTPPPIPAPPPTRTIIVITPPPHVSSDVNRSPLPGAGLPPLSTQPIPSSTHTLPPTVINPPLPPQPAASHRTLRDGHNMPAVTHLISQAKIMMDQGRLDVAEQQLTRAQRMAPDNTAIYAYLSSISLQRKNGAQAEAMARRGLLVTSNPAQQKAFWQLILLAAQQQGNSRSENEAQSAIARFP
jgi:hypothetical protein